MLLCVLRTESINSRIFDFSNFRFLFSGEWDGLTSWRHNPLTPRGQSDARHKGTKEITNFLLEFQLASTSQPHSAYARTCKMDNFPYMRLIFLQGGFFDSLLNQTIFDFQQYLVGRSAIFSTLLLNFPVKLNFLNLNIM